MLKYLSYFNIFLGLVFFGLSKVNGGDIFLIFLPLIFFNWLTLNYPLKNFKLEKWHKVIGAISFVYALLSGVTAAYLLVSSSFNFYFYLVFARFIYGVSTIAQLLLTLGLDEQLRASLVSAK